MSKQSNEQDERKSPTGAASGTAPNNGKAAGADKEGAAAQRPGNGAKANAGAASAKHQGKPQGKPQNPAKGATKPPSAPSAETQAEPAKTESSKVEPSNTEPAKNEPAKTEPSKTESSKAESSKTESRKAAPAGAGSAVGGGGAGGSGAGKGGGKAGALALVLVVLLALAVGFFAQRMWQRLDAQQQGLAALQSSAEQAASQSALSSLEERLEQRLAEGESARNAELNSALSELRERFTSYRGEIDGTLDQVLAELSSQQEPDAREWLHAEAAYLLRLANQRLQLERDVEGAIALLETADARLDEANNPALLSVRRAIASEIAVLQGVPQVDRTGLYLALNAQQERLAQLPLSRELEEIPARAGLQEAPRGGWQQQLALFGEELKDLVVIRHHDQALESLISPEQESYLRQSVRLVLEQAQLALLKEEQTLYEASLDKVLTLIDGYYATDQAEVQAVVERLQALKGETIRPELPDIGGSQQALAAFIENRFGPRAGQGDDA